MTPSSSYSLEVMLTLSMGEAETAVRDALQREGFGIISEIDIAAKLKEKLGIDHPPHKILGACNPKLAYQALQGNIDAALALPCNVILREEGDHTIITALLPSIALQPFAGTSVQDAAKKAEEALHQSFSHLVS